MRLESTFFLSKCHTMLTAEDPQMLELVNRVGEEYSMIN